MSLKKRVKYVIRHSIEGSLMAGLVTLILIMALSGFNDWLGWGEYREPACFGLFVFYVAAAVVMLYLWAKEPEKE
jgi:hypothetical protein